MGSDQAPGGWSHRLVGLAIGIIAIAIALDVAVHILYSVRIALLIWTLVVLAVVGLRAFLKHRSSRW